MLSIYAAGFKASTAAKQKCRQEGTSNGRPTAQAVSRPGWSGGADGLEKATPPAACYQVVGRSFFSSGRPKVRTVSAILSNR